MSRTQKLYDRLDECEREYLLLAREEFGLLAAGTVGMLESFAFVVAEPHAAGKSARFDWLEKEIRSLRKKLREPIQSSVVWIVEQFRRQYSELGVKQRPEIWTHRCKDMLLNLNAFSESATRPPRL